MIRLPRPMAVLALVVLLCFGGVGPFASQARAAGATTQPALVPTSAPAPAATIKGLRIFTCGHSFHWFVYPLLEEMAKAADIPDHQSVGLAKLGGSKVIQHWNGVKTGPALPDDKNAAKVALRAGKVDVLTLSPIWMPDEGIESFARLGLENNPAFRVTVQKFWLPNDTYEPVYPLDTKKKVDHNAVDLAELQKNQDRYDQDVDDYVRGINAKLGKDVIVTVPVGQAVVALRRKVVAGEAPGIKAQSELFRDSWGHGLVAIEVLDGYCHFAVIYGRSPVGLPVPSSFAKLANLSEKDKNDLNHLLQGLAWDAVSHYGLRGK